MLAEIDHHAELVAGTRQKLDEARVELAAANVDATTRLMALGNVRRLLADVYAKLEHTEPVDWFNVVDQAASIIDGATANPGNGDEPDDEDAPPIRVTRWPASHADAGVAPDPTLDDAPVVLDHQTPPRYT